MAGRLLTRILRSTGGKVSKDPIKKLPKDCVTSIGQFQLWASRLNGDAALSAKTRWEVYNAKDPVKEQEMENAFVCLKLQLSKN